ncbi:MAG TPA: ABC transporter ATP-binding protein, partial [Chroococcales cyanobacterium]
WSMSMLYEGNLFVTNLFEFLELPHTMKILPNDQTTAVPAKLKEGIRFESVVFSYPDKTERVLDGVSFTLLPGQSVALVGENGAGKTTIVKLLSRLHDPTEGRIVVDGIDLKQYDLQAWREKISVIFQDFCRYHMTARENIGIGKVGAIEDLALVKEAAQRSNAEAVIDKLADGYETTLGHYYSTRDKGAELSGGEWQKLGLARAFMRSNNHGSANMDAQLLILDEPTAALDAKAEHDVYMRFHELTRGKTTFLISHRFSTVKMADLILVLENGKIIEQGNHTQLMDKEGEYARLFKLQADRYQ